MITWDDFEKIEIHCGTVTAASEFPNARKPAFQLVIDFGDLGIKKSSAQLTELYKKEELVGRQVIAVTNFPPKQIGNFFSECLVLGVYNEYNQVVLLQPNIPVKNGSKIG
jgi:tRNA-binding protein